MEGPGFAPGLVGVDGPGSGRRSGLAGRLGGQETTLFSILTTLMHHGMVLVGLPYSFQGQMRVDEVTGGAPYGATTIAGGDGSRQPSGTELDGARFLGRHAAEVAAKLKG